MVRSIARIGWLLLVLMALGGPWASRALACDGVGCLPAAPAQVDAPQTLFQGITYQREVRQEPRPLVIHHVTIDLAAPGISFFVRPGTPGEPQPLRLTTDFLTDYDLQLAINANYFSRVEEPEGLLRWMYVPGDLADVIGLAMSDGLTYQSGVSYSPVMYITADNEISFQTPPDAPWNAIAGNRMLLRYGERAVRPEINERTGINPRTAIGIDREGTTLTIVVVDGRQPGYSEGVSLWEIADLMQAYGVEFALNLDGGGSSTLAMLNPDGTPEVLNSPVGNRLPGTERPVAVQLGIHALPVEEGE
jgi:hypothetical protein